MAVFRELFIFSSIFHAANIEKIDFTKFMTHATCHD